MNGTTILIFLTVFFGIMSIPTFMAIFIMICGIDINKFIEERENKNE